MPWICGQNADWRWLVATHSFSNLRALLQVPSFAPACAACLPPRARHWRERERSGDKRSSRWVLRTFLQRLEFIRLDRELVLHGLQGTHRRGASPSTRATQE